VRAGRYISNGFENEMINSKRKQTSLNNSSSSSAKKVSSPVFAGPDTLPLLDPNFTWEKFEKFSKELLKAIYSDHEVKLIGVKGQKQYGIDLVAQDKAGNYFFAQNKRYKTYSVAQFKTAKSELELEGNKTILLLACEASAELRLEVLGDSKWDIWDVNDISNKIFQLENQTRYELVKRFFGIEWARAFSEYNEYSSIVSPIDFYRSFLDSKKLFNHTVPFLGRDEELSYLKKFVSESHQALVLNAAGGIGKSRLLWEFSKNCAESGWRVLFIKEDMSPDADHFQSINSKKVIFVFDDAHRFDPTPYLSFIYPLKNIKYKIIFSTRPQGREKLKLSLLKNNIESSEIQDYEVKKFTLEDAKSIVLNLLPQFDAQHIWAIAKLLADSTLVGILACSLIKRKSVSLLSLSNELDIKGKILSSFTDELCGKIDSRLNNDLIQKILSYFSALSPVVYEEKKIDPEFIFATGEKESDVKECIADLLHSEILVERGGRLRISPDVLSDCILERSCYLKNDAPSDFFKNLFELVDSKLRNNLLKNISELDWRKKKNKLTSSLLLSDFWSKFKNTSLDDLFTLNNKLKIVKSIAYFQPIESYEALLGSIESLSKFSANNQNYNFNSCKGSIIDICRDIIFAGHNVENLMMTVWDLGRKDKRELNSNFDHPIRRLSDLCSYEPGFPISHYERTLKGLIAIIDVYDSKNDHHEPISILGGFLVKTSCSTYSEGFKFTINPFHILYENTKKIRNEVFNILKKLALSEDLKTAYLAVKEISKAAKPPYGMMELKFTKTQSEVWNKEISGAIDLLIEIYEKTSLSLIKVYVKNDLNDKKLWLKHSHCKKMITNFFMKNPFTIDELKYVPFAFQSYYKELLVQEDLNDHKKTYEEEKKVYEKITKDIVSKYKTPKEILKYTENLVSELLTVNNSIDTRRFSILLSETINNQEMCNALLENNSNRIVYDFCIFLRKVSDKNNEMAIQYVEKALTLENLTILTSIAKSFWWIFEGKETDSKFLNLFEKIFRHKSEDIRIFSLQGLIHLVSQDKKVTAIQYMMALDMSSKRIVKDLFALLIPYLVKFEELTDTQMSELLSKLKEIEDLSDHGVSKFISECANRIPNDLFDVLFYRVESKRNREMQFKPIPYSGFGKLSLNLSDDEILKIFDKIVKALHKEDANTFWLPQLFYDLANSKYELAINYLTDMIKSDDIEVVDVGTNLLQEFDHSLVFTKQDWVRDLLTHGKDKGSQFFDKIKNNLFRVGIPKSKGGTAGEPMPQDVALVENATAAIAKATSEHEKQFYAELKEYGEREIAHTIKENERFFDE
jgi:hypothetical protein